MTHEPVEIAAGGATLAGDRWHGAGATIVLLHAGVCDRRCWREVGARLGAAGRDVVAYDRRGFGDVPPADGPFRHVDDLLAVLDAVSPDAPAWLVGSSMGGQVALDAALEAPERVAGLVLLAPAVSGDPELDEEAYNAATDGLAGAIDAAWTAGEQEACNRLEVRLWLDGPAGPEGRVSGPPRELALDMNRIVIANGEPDADGAQWTRRRGPRCTRSRSRPSSPAASSTSRSRSGAAPSWPTHSRTPPTAACPAARTCPTWRPRTEIAALIMAEVA